MTLHPPELSDTAIPFHGMAMKNATNTSSLLSAQFKIKSPFTPDISL